VGKNKFITQFNNIDSITTQFKEQICCAVQDNSTKNVSAHHEQQWVVGSLLADREVYFFVSSCRRRS
jgi:hypothetical protein